MDNRLSARRFLRSFGALRQVPVIGPPPSPPLRSRTPPQHQLGPRPPGASQKEPGGGGKREGEGGEEGLWVEGRVLQLQWGDGGAPSKGQLGPAPHLGVLEILPCNGLWVHFFNLALGRVHLRALAFVHVWAPFQKSEQLPCRSAECNFSPFFSVKGVVKSGVKFRVRVSACYVSQGSGVRSGKFHPNIRPKTV